MVTADVPVCTSCWLPSIQLTVIEVEVESLFSVVVIAPLAPMASRANGVEVPMPTRPLALMLKRFCAVVDAIWKKLVVESCVSITNLVVSVVVPTPRRFSTIRLPVPLAADGQLSDDSEPLPQIKRLSLAKYQSEPLARARMSPVASTCSWA